MAIAPSGQACTHSPQRVQTSWSSVSRAGVPAVSESAAGSQTFTHFPQPVHESST